MSASNIPPVQPGTARPAAAPPQVVPIVSLPDGLKNNARAIKLDGEVVQQNNDGSTRVKTSEGTIDISLRGRQPQPGARIEIEIPPGNPPRQAAIRPMPAQLTQQQPAPPSTGQTPQTQAPQTEQAQTRPAPPPPTYQPPPPAGQSAPQPAIPAQPPLTTRPMEPGQTVRLTPLPPAQAQAMIAQSLQAAASAAITLSADTMPAQVARAAFQAGLVARAVPDEIQKTLIQTITAEKPIPPQSATTALSAAPSSPRSTPAMPGAPQTTGQNFLAGMTGAPLLPDGQSVPQLRLLPIMPQAGAPPGAMVPPPLPMEVGIVQLLRAGFITHSSLETQIQAPAAAPRLIQIDLQILAVIPPATQIVANPAMPGMIIPDAATGLPLKIPTDNTGLILKSPTMTGTATPAALTGIVTGFTPQNLPIVTLQWPGGALSQNFILQFPAQNLDIGSEIIFAPQAPAATGTGGTAPRPLLPLMEATSIWPALDEMYQTLLQINPAAAQAMARMMPSPANPSHMGAAALLFVAAVRAGDIGGWMGEKRSDAIARIGKDSILSRLTQDANNARGANADIPDTEWRSYPVPMVWQNEIAKVMLHIKHEQQEENREDSGDATRFIMDLSLNRMGEVQLDGMVRGKRLDLIVRTQLPISVPMQDAMRTAYIDALANTDVYGDIAFQGDFKGWVQVLKRDEKLTASA